MTTGIVIAESLMVVIVAVMVMYGIRAARDRDLARHYEELRRRR